MITQTYEQALREFQVNLLSNALVDTNGNVCKAAQLLGIHRNTFDRMLGKAALMPPLAVRAHLKEQGFIAGPSPGRPSRSPYRRVA